jgi:HJR/Mrr/RecB family endonuclease
MEDIKRAEGRLSELDRSSISLTVKARFQARIDKLHLLDRELRQGEAEAKARAERTRAEREIEANLHALKEKHKKLIDAFYEVAERKVSMRDDYGDEQWDALDKEIKRVISKIQTAEGYRFSNCRRLVDLSKFLAQSFKERHKKKSTEKNRVVDCSRMSGVEFEAYVSRILGQLGFSDIRMTPATNDQGADLLAKKEGRTIVIQTKRYSSPVGNSAVQEVVGALKFYSGQEGWVVTNSTFTTSAKQLAQKAGIRLIDGFELRDLSNRK